MRKKIVAANWKMNLLPQEGSALVKQVLQDLPTLQGHQHVVFAAPYTHLFAAQHALQGAGSNAHLAAQNCHTQANGAYTGEVSLPMLQSFGVSHVLVGHSERRQYNHESNDLLKQKVDVLLAAGVKPIFCCGEALDIREAGTQNQFVQTQIEESLFHLSAEDFSKVVIAYEPIWAIGTGVTASSAQAQDMHAHLRGLIAAKYGEQVAQDFTILYGGSCNASNAAELFAQSDIDGGLIGGAALKAETFLPIVQAMP
ncbi:MAG: hypothetical protein RL660_2882 [Bacteroidota bacterium]|jgi:triosephosphate isomerase